MINTKQNIIILKYLIISIIIITLSQYTIAIQDVQGLDTYNLNGTGISIDYNENIDSIFVYCRPNTCQTYGNGTTIIKVNTNSNTIQRSDYTNPSKTTSMFYFDATSTMTSLPFPYNNLQLPFLITSYADGFTWGSSRDRIYQYDDQNDFWSERYSYEPCCSVLGSRFYGIKSIIDQRNAFNKNIAFVYDRKETGQVSAIWQINISTGVLSGPIRFVANARIFENREADGNDNYYTTSGIRLYDNIAISVLNYTIPDMTYGLVIPSDDYYIYTNNHTIYTGKLSEISTSQPINLMDMDNSCATLLGNSGQSIYDIDCRDSTNCIFVGKWNSDGFIISYNGDDCKFLDLTDDVVLNSGNPINLTNNILYNVKYNDGETSFTYDDYYYITGSNTLFRFLAGSVAPTINTYEACITPNQYCSQASFSIQSNITYCTSYLYVENCNAGCFNNSNVYECRNTCTNECNIEGSAICDSGKSYRICQDTNNDGCLEYGSRITCNTNQYCSAVGQFFATCSNLPEGIISNSSTFNVVPYSDDDSTTLYSDDNVNRRITITTSNLVHTQKFMTTAPSGSYTTRTCDYRENIIFDNKIITTLNDTLSLSFTTTGTSSYVTTSIIPRDNTPILFSIRTLINIDTNSIVIFRNSSSKSVSIRYLNGTEIYLDVSNNVYDDLQSVDVSVYYDFITDTNNMKFTFKRDSIYSVYTIPKSFTGDDISTIVFNSSNATINSVSVYRYTTPSGFSINEQSFEFLPCIYTTTGTYITRTYNNLNGYPDYSNYIDYTIIISELSSSTVSGGEDVNSFVNNLFGKGLSSVEKLFYTIMIMFVTILLVVIIGFTYGMSGLMVGVLTTILAVVELIFFAFIGFIPVWIIVLLIILCAGIIGVFAKRVFVQ